MGPAPSAPQAASLRQICQAPVLAASFGRQARTGTRQQRSVPVTLTNRGHGTCHLRGYPRVDLVQGSLARRKLGFRPDTIWVMPPGSGSHLTVKWRFRPVLGSTTGTGATTNVSPVGS